MNLIEPRAPAAEEIDQERQPYDADDGGHRIGFDGPADAGGAAGCLLGENSAFCEPLIDHRLRLLPQVLGALGVVADRVAGQIGALVAAVVGQFGAAVLAVVGKLVGGVAGDLAGLLRELTEMILRRIAGLARSALQVAGETTSFATVDKVQPGHCEFAPDFKTKRANRLSSSRPCRLCDAAYIVTMTTGALMSTAQARLDRQFDRIGRQVPASAGFLRWVRQPHMHLVRVPLALLLIVGGVFSFLPILGLWMLPLGLAVLAVDVPPLKRPVGDFLVRLQRWIANLRRRWRRRPN